MWRNGRSRSTSPHLGQQRQSLSSQESDCHSPCPVSFTSGPFGSQAPPAGRYAVAWTSVNPHCGQRNPKSLRCIRAALHFGHSGGAAAKLMSAPTADAVPAADATFLLPVIADSTVSKAPNTDAACPRSHQSGGRCLSLNVEAPFVGPVTSRASAASQRRSASVSTPPSLSRPAGPGRRPAHGPGRG